MYKKRPSHSRGHRNVLPNENYIKWLLIALITILLTFVLVISFLLISTRDTDEIEEHTIVPPQRLEPTNEKRSIEKTRTVNDEQEDTNDENTDETDLGQDIIDQLNLENDKLPKAFKPGQVVVVVGMPRSGSTLLFNIARLLVEYEDPNTISGYEIPAEEVYYWASNNISVVIKAHDMFKTYINPLKNNISSADGTYSVGKGTILADYVFYSKRDLKSAMCSLYRLGWVNETTSKRRCINMVSMNKTINRRLKMLTRRKDITKPKYCEPFTFDEITQGRKSMASLIKKISKHLGIDPSPERIAWVENAVKALKPVALPSGDSRSTQNPRSLLHSNHLSTSDTRGNDSGNANWDCSPVFEWIMKVRKCKKVYMEENGFKI